MGLGHLKKQVIIPFTPSELAEEPGWMQIGVWLLVAVGCSGLAFAMFGRCIENWAGNALVFILIALSSLVTLFHSNDKLVWATGAITLVALIWAIWRHSRIASPKLAPAPETKEVAPSRPEDLESVISEREATSADERRRKHPPPPMNPSLVRRGRGCPQHYF